ncbi:hypothetical protein SNEBB_001652 [Seison nebaliae]|nr:hypothetical protein SNEBB_001652 [Seison nebaliae]
MNSLPAAYNHPIVRKWQCKLVNNDLRDMLIYPIFLVEDDKAKQEINGMINQYRFGRDTVIPYLNNLIGKGLKSIILFPVVSHENKCDGLDIVKTCEKFCKNISHIRQHFPDLLVIVDVCLCAYTHHGHCAILEANSEIDYKLTLMILSELTEYYVLAGAQVLAPSGMIDGTVRTMKNRLKKMNQNNRIPILTYCSKFSSKFYGPFRNAANSAPAFGDRSTYQLPYGSRELAIRSTRRDVEAGADMIMVKPASHYLDVVMNMKQQFPEYPLAVYQVSGEYSMICTAVENGIIELDDALDELFTSFKRAGADIIITYFVPYLLERNYQTK